MEYHVVICEDEPLFAGGLRERLEHIFAEANAELKVTEYRCGQDFYDSLINENADASGNKSITGRYSYGENMSGGGPGKQFGEGKVTGGKPSLIFMDISLGDRDGVELIREYRVNGGTKVPVIFLSSMEDRVLDGYDVNAMAFLYKRSYEERLKEVIRRFFAEYAESAVMTVKCGSNISVLTIHDIYSIESDGRRTLIHTATGQVKDDRPVGTFIKEIGAVELCETYKCVFVNPEHVARIDEDAVLLDNGESVILSRRKRKPVMDSVMRYIGRL